LVNGAARLFGFFQGIVESKEKSVNLKQSGFMINWLKVLLISV